MESDILKYSEVFMTLIKLLIRIFQN